MLRFSEFCAVFAASVFLNHEESLTKHKGDKVLAEVCSVHRFLIGSHSEFVFLAGAPPQIRSFLTMFLPLLLLLCSLFSFYLKKI